MFTIALFYKLDRLDIFGTINDLEGMCVVSTLCQALS